MKILHIIATLDPEFGGPAEAVRALISHAPEGSSSEIVTLDDPAALYLEDLPVVVHALGPRTSNYGSSRRLLPWLKANRERFDGAVVHGLWQSAGLSAWRAMHGRTPYAVFTHGMLDPYFKRAFPLKHMKKWVYWVLVEYWVLRGASRVLFTCEAEEQLARQSFWLHHWRAQVTPLGTVPPMRDPEEQREAFLAVCPAVRGKRFLLFLGRIHPKKGCDLLVNAFAKLATLDPEVELVMAGPDAQQWRMELERQAEASGVAHRIHWPGMLLGDAKWGAYLASEAFVLPSHQENFGIAVAEALACGRPVLLSDKVNIAADVVADGAGMAEPDTVAGTERLLKRWIQMPDDERRAMAARASACFAGRYDMRENAKAVVRLFAVAGASTEQRP
jgi:glycosyltransferase involved in cell wall biosynthesis